MNHSVIHHYAQPVTVAQVRDVSTGHVWQWLAAGWQDLRQAPAQSLGYGLALTLLSYLITIAVIGSGSYFLLPLLWAGFFLLAPILAIGPYAISRQLEAGKTPTLRDGLHALRDNSFHLFNMGVVLVVACLVWAMLANLIFVLFFQGITPAGWQGFLAALFSSWEGAQLLLVGIVSGMIIAFLVFGISAVSVPMLLDRSSNVFDAIQTSWTAVRYNTVPMLLWAMILVVVILAGFFTLYVGLVIGFPLLAHATWHAYRDLVDTEKS